MSYNKLNIKEATSLLIEKDHQIGDLTDRNEKLESAQNAFMFELKKEMDTYKSKSKFIQFFQGAALAFRIFKRSQEYFQGVADKENDISKHLID